MLFEIIMTAIWLMLPAYVPNTCAALVGGDTPISALICLPSGAMTGDLVKSFLKRRVGFKQGAPLPLVDQLDLVVGAWVFTYVFSHGWFVANFTLWVMLVILIITPVLHITVNIIGYKLGKKDVPW